MSEEIRELRELASLTVKYLKQLQEGGEHNLFFARVAEDSEARPAGKEERGAAQTGAGAEEHGAPARGPDEVVKALTALRRRVESCRRCPLWKTRTRAVFGEGSPRARVMFVGEAPGGEEDRTGKPFVGRAGQLLTKMLRAIDLERRDVYITNVLKSRPPGNRDPRPEEVEKCEPYLLAQLDLIRPALICALGRHAAQTLLSTKEGINKLRGRFLDYHGVTIMPTFHPAYLLRNPADKKKAWADLKKLRSFLNERKA